MAKTEETETEGKKKADKFKQWEGTFTIGEYINAPLEELKKAQVDCNTCPVNALCLTGQTQDDEGVYACEDCGSTAIKINDKKSKVFRFLLIDCAKHNFKISKKLKPCEMCDGRSTKFYVLGQEAHGTRYMLPTVNSKLDIKDRQEKFKESFEHWSKIKNERDREIAKEAEKRAAALKKAADEIK